MLVMILVCLVFTSFEDSVKIIEDLIFDLFEQIPVYLEYFQCRVLSEPNELVRGSI